MKWMIAVVLIVSVGVSLAFAADLDGVRFVKISSYDQKAVIKTAAGELKLVGVGDMIGEKMVIKEIAGDQLVLETPGLQGPETLIVSLDKNGEQKVDRMGPAPKNEGRP
jgi:hypothetical protein